ncbi:MULTISPECIES: AAA family ATPase [Streptomyces]|uniref:hypothetical protein n=1 Tax=Streptomyces TaxID=1883 RepID=UPI0036FF360F
MGLERWEKQYKTHSVWTLAQDIQDLLSSSAERVTPDERDYFDRLKMAMAYICEMGQEPVLIIPMTALNNLHQNLAQIQSNITTWNNGGGSNYLTSAAEGYLDTVFDIIRTWPPSKDRYARGLRAAATEFVADAQSAMDSIRDRVGELQRNIEETTNNTYNDFSRLLENAREQIDVNQEEVAQLRTDVSNMSVTVTAQAQRLDQAINAYQTSYSEAEASRTESHQRALEKLADETVSAAERARTQSDDLLTAQKESGQKILEEMAALNEQTVQLVNAIGLTGTATEYGRYAEQERKSANTWRLGAVSAFACSFLLFLATLLVSHIDEKTPWQVIAVRFGGSIALLAGGLYMARESSQHRQEERRAKSVQLDLAALDPFIVNLPSEQRESIKAAAAARLFVERGSNVPPVEQQQNEPSALPEGVTPDALRLAQSLAEMLKK